MKVLVFFVFIVCLYSCENHNTSGKSAPAPESNPSTAPIYTTEQVRQNFAREGSFVINRYQAGFNYYFPNMVPTFRDQLREDNLQRARMRRNWNRNPNQDQGSRYRDVIHEVLELAGQDDRNYHYTDQILNYIN